MRCIKYQNSLKPQVVKRKAFLRFSNRRCATAKASQNEKISNTDVIIDFDNVAEHMESCIV